MPDMVPLRSLRHFLNASRIVFAVFSTSVILSPASSLPALDSLRVRLATSSGRLSSPMASLANVFEYAMTVGRTSKPLPAPSANIH